MKKVLTIMAVVASSWVATAQVSHTSLPEGGKAPTVLIPSSTINIDFKGTLSTFSVLSNCDYSLNPVWAEGETPWYTLTKRKDGEWKIKGNYWYKPTPRNGSLEIILPNGQKQTIDVVQEANQSIDSFVGDYLVEVQRAVASQQNSESESINKSIDGNPNTHYHSPWVGTKFPVTLDYIFAEGKHLDYFVYTPRQDQDNGRWGKVTIQYTTADAPSTFVTLAERDFAFTSNSVSVKLGAEGTDNIKQVRFVVKTGCRDYVTCGEMEFFQINEDEAIHPERLFTDNLCYELKPGITDADILKEPNAYLRQLASYLLHEKYDTAFRVGEYEPYETLETVSKRQKTGYYCRYENPTGLYFEAGDRNVIFVDGLQEQYSVSLIIKDFGGSGDQPESMYPLKNGFNIITAKNKGNSYVSYYTDDYKNAPNIRMHVPFAKVNGYFDLDRGDTNEDWVKMLANACSDIMDIRCKRLQVAFTTERLRKVCPDNAVELAHTYDSVIYYERQVMGLEKYGIEPKNRQFARCIWGKSMHADGVGAAAFEEWTDAWMEPDRSKFGYWGFGHELGHVNQVRPGLKWVGCGETTNNIYSAWVTFKLSGQHLNLEREKTGIREFSGMEGGRYNCYLEEGVRLGRSWQLQNGPDYRDYELDPKNKISVKHEDYDGYRNGRDTTVVSCNYDHFVKLIPLWQLILYCDQLGYSPDVYAKVCQSIRNTDESGMTDGQLQLKFIRTVCDSTKLNFLPFFEKAGMFRPIHAYIQDYGCDWLSINQEMLDEVTKHVEAQGYPLPEGEVNYVSGLNWLTYANKLPVKGGAVNEGCSQGTDKRFVKIDHKVWQNAVAFETYDAHDKLVRITMMGLGADDKISYTMAMFPSGASYIMAVGWDGTRIKCYERK